MSRVEKNIMKRLRYRANRDERRVESGEYYHKNKEARDLQAKKYYEENRAKILEQKRRRRRLVKSWSKEKVEIYIGGDHGN